MSGKSNHAKPSDPVDLSIDPETVTKILTGFIKDSLKKTGSKMAIIGLSGGLDSSVVSSLAVRTLGKEKTLCVLMPYRTSSKASRNDAEKLAQSLGLRTEVRDISPMVDAFEEYLTPDDSDRKANIMARQRMVVLYDISAREKGIVLGTSNKSELLLGYGTIFGDLASAVNPVGDLYKTQMRQLAEFLEIPEFIRTKTPTADLVEGQTDESDLGFCYEEADRLLYLWVDKKINVSDLGEYGFEPEFIETVLNRVRRNQFKRMPPLIGKISAATIGHEFRYAWDWSTLN